MTVDEKGLEAAVEAVMRFGTHSRLRASALAKECILAYESAKSAEGAVDGAIVVEQPYHGGRYIIAYKGGSLTGWSYPSAEAAQAELDAICAALVLPAIERARVEERERAALRIDPTVMNACINAGVPVTAARAYASMASVEYLAECDRLERAAIRKG